MSLFIETLRAALAEHDSPGNRSPFRDRTLTLIGRVREAVDAEEARQTDAACGGSEEDGSLPDGFRVLTGQEAAALLSRMQAELVDPRAELVAKLAAEFLSGGGACDKFGFAKGQEEKANPTLNDYSRKILRLAVAVGQQLARMTGAFPDHPDGPAWAELTPTGDVPVSGDWAAAEDLDAERLEAEAAHLLGWMIDRGGTLKTDETPHGMTRATVMASVRHLAKLGHIAAGVAGCWQVTAAGMADDGRTPPVG